MALYSWKHKQNLSGKVGHSGQTRRWGAACALPRSSYNKGATTIGRTTCKDVQQTRELSELLESMTQGCLQDKAEHKYMCSI